MEKKLSYAYIIRKPAKKTYNDYSIYFKKPIKDLPVYQQKLTNSAIMSDLAFLHAHRDDLRKGIPDKNQHLTHYLLSTLAGSIAEYNEYLQYFKSGKRKYPKEFRLFTIRLNRFVFSHFTERVNRVWKKVIRKSNRRPVSNMPHSQLLFKRHSARLACLQYLLKCLVDNFG